jgi:hypothetical protein
VVIIIIVHLSTISACTISLWSRGDSQGGLGTAYVTYVSGGFVDWISYLAALLLWTGCLLGGWTGGWV